mmetsp:Transcript_127911/g.409763  ORF Transcript_127911/g.409763 Transcript_127911/m.409763 type:complete len:298 (+) Transcript_127911:152-1045(+)
MNTSLADSHAETNKGAQPFVYSEHAVCIRDSEGSFSERQNSFSGQLKKSLSVSKADLLHRNILQSVSVVSRGKNVLHGFFEARPTLEDLKAKRKLAPDYEERLFPADPANSVAPLAERIERVSLHRLLAPPTTNVAAAPSGRAPGPLDLAMLADMMQMAIMSGARGISPVASGPGGAMLMPTGPVFPTTMASPFGVPSVAGRPVTPMTAGNVHIPGDHAAPPSSVFALAAPTRPPKPSLQDQRMAKLPGSPLSVTGRAEKTPFLQLLDSFCDRVLGSQESGSHSRDLDVSGMGRKAP